MSRAMMLVALLLAVLAVACDGSGSSGSPSTSRASEPPAPMLPTPSASEMPTRVATTPHAEEPRESERPPPLRVAPTTLAISAVLPRPAGSTALPADARIDFTRTLVVAGGEKFVVTGFPELVPCGAGTSTFMVMGSTAAPIAGRMMLPELLFEDDAEEEPPR